MQPTPAILTKNRLDWAFGLGFRLRPDRDSSHSHVPPTGLLHRHAARTLQAIHPHWECRSNCFKSVTPTERGLTVGWHVSNFNTDMSKSKSLPRKNNFMVHKYEYESWIEKVAQ